MSIFDNVAIDVRVVGRPTTGIRAKVRLGLQGRDKRIYWRAAPPREVELYLQHDRAGRCCTVGLEGVICAEFDPRHDHQTPTVLCCEDHAMDVLELPLGTPVSG